ncbi:MAG TPA: carboxypeptidase regulatory-like domain-containing protein [Gemmatimonadaceae bacterium]|nr:carboxypeptidase regulatory-like domain-containing protein [Gemmatimonadaceae bacterium]
MTPAIVAAWLTMASSGWSVRGTIRRADSNAPLPGAVVEVLDANQRATSDNDGAYALTALACTTCRLRFSAAGFVPTEILVTRGTDPETDVNVVLSPEPRPLPPIVVVGDDANGHAQPVDFIGPGTSTHDAAELERSPLANDPDPLRALTGSADALAPPDVDAMLHVRGGAADQNLVLLDGLPIYSAYHAGGSLSAISPDLIHAVTLDAGVPSARYGGALTSIISMDTRHPESLSGRGAADVGAVRQTVEVPLPAEGAGIVGEVRRSTNPFGLHVVDGGAARDYSDGALTVTVPAPAGSLELLAFGTQDHVRFDGVVDSTHLGSGANPTNATAWSGATEGAVWTVTLRPGTELTVRGWHADAATRIQWNATGGSTRIADDLQSVGASAEGLWRTDHGAWVAGGQLERMATTYSVLTDRQARIAMVSAFVERRWTPSPRFGLAVGVRDDAVPGIGSTLEPRVAARYALTSAVSVAAGYARSAQAVQSLGNEESIVDAVLPIALPVAADGHGVPIARADEVTGSVTVALGPATRVALDGYERWSTGLVASTASTAQPFATDSLTQGTGLASGLTLALDHEDDRLTLQAAYGVAAVRRQIGAIRYVPSFAAPRIAVAAVGYTLFGGTTVTGTVWGAAGRPTSVIGDALQFQSYVPIGGVGDLEGTPTRIIGALDSRRLPMYQRIDLGVVQRWTAGLFGHSAQLIGRVRVTNVLNHANVVGEVLPSGVAQTRQLTLLPRSLQISIGWAF